jgi:hypothetical protein
MAFDILLIDGGGTFDIALLATILADASIAETGDTLSSTVALDIVATASIITG